MIAPGQTSARRPRSTALSIEVSCWIFCFAGYALFVAWYMGAYGGASDASGYGNSATLLRSGHILAPQRVLADAAPPLVAGLTYVPVGFVAVHTNQLAPSYPFGLPLLVTFVSFFTGVGLAPHATMWLHTIGGVLLFFCFARQSGVSPRLSAVGALLLATSPLYLGMGIQLMSDVPALVWVLLALWLAGTFGKTCRGSAIAGVVFSIAVLVRPTNLLAFPALVLALPLNRPRLASLLIGGIPGALAYALLHHTAYGSPFSSGYGNPSTHFTWHHWAATLPHYARWLPVFLSPLVGLVLLSPFLRVPRRAVLLLWSGAFLGFYASYSFTQQDEWSLRFLLPAFPPLIVTALLVLSAFSENRVFTPIRHPARLAHILGAALLVSAVVWNANLRTLDHRRSQREYTQTSAWAADHLPSDAVVIAQQISGILYHDTRCVIVRWDQLNPGDFARIENAAKREGRNVFAMTFPYEEPAVLDLAPGRWIKMHKVRQTTVWRLDS